MNLSDYSGGMGAGQINATQLLAALDGVSVEVRFPNLYLKEGGAEVLDPARYFKQGDGLERRATVVLDHGA